MSVHPYFDVDMLILTQEAHQEKLITKTNAGEFKRLAHQYNDFIRLYCDTSVHICKPQRKKKTLLKTTIKTLLKIWFTIMNQIYQSHVILHV